MNRPKKSKANNPTLPEDQQVDERNIIDLEESSEVSIEDRIHLYWMENKGFVTGSITLIAFVIIAFNGMRIYKEASEKKLQDNYAAAQAGDELQQFAEANADKNLGGFAALLVADEFYTNEDFENAAQFYNKAAGSLTDEILVARARLGEGFATFYGTDQIQGRVLITSVATDSSLPETIRNEAAYHLAIDSDVMGATETFESYAQQISSGTASGQWQQRIEIYKQQR